MIAQRCDTPENGIGSLPRFAAGLSSGKLRVFRNLGRLGPSQATFLPSHVLVWTEALRSSPGSGTKLRGVCPFQRYETISSSGCTLAYLNILPDLMRARSLFYDISTS